MDVQNKRFKLPRTKFGFEGLRNKIGNDIQESLPNITGEVSNGSTFAGDQFSDVSSTSIIENGALKGVRSPISRYAMTNSSQTYERLWDGIALNASDSSSTYQDGAPVQERGTQMYLYFYVGKFEDEAIKQTAGLNSEMFNQKADVTTPSIQAPYLKETYINGTSGYNIWSNGYCEQWGAWMRDAGTTKTITLLKNYRDTEYNILCQQIANFSGNVGTGYDLIVSSVIITTNSFRAGSPNISNVGDGLYWKTCGYLADGEY